MINIMHMNRKKYIKFVIGNSEHSDEVFVPRREVQMLLFRSLKLQVHELLKYPNDYLCETCMSDRWMQTLLFSLMYSKLEEMKNERK